MSLGHFLLLFSEVTNAMLSIFSIQASILFAAENGPTLAIAIALITLVGTVSANLVLWHKTRVESRLAASKLATDQKRSDVEIAQNVLSQTVTMLNERLQSESEAHQAALTAMERQQAREIEIMKSDHTRDITRLDHKINRITAELTECKSRNRALQEELIHLRGGRQ